MIQILPLTVQSFHWRENHGKENSCLLAFCLIKLLEVAPPTNSYQFRQPGDLRRLEELHEPTIFSKISAMNK